MKEFLFQQFSTIGSSWAAGLPIIAGNDTINQNADGTARSGIIDLPVNKDINNRKIYAYLFARVASDAFAYFECRVQLLLHGEVMVSLPLIYSYKNTAGLGDLFRVGAFTWSNSTDTVPIIVPGSIPLKLGSAFAQLQNPPPDETTGLVYLHPFSVPYNISKIRVDIVRWTNMNVNGGGRVVVVSKAD